MGVLRERLGLLGGNEDEDPPFVCASCERALDVQYHSCPYCGSYDVRRSEWA